MKDEEKEKETSSSRNGNSGWFISSQPTKAGKQRGIR